MSKKNIAIALVFLVLLSYMVLDLTGDYLTGKNREAYVSGYTQGSLDAASTINQKLSNCQVLTITTNDVTRNVVDIDCLSNEVVR